MQDGDDLAFDDFDPIFLGRFLRHILPSNGPYCPYSRGVQPHPLVTIDETVAWIARHAKGDCNIALACWSGTRGAKGTFAGARAFWADLDIGEEHQFASQLAAVDRLNTLIAGGLPNPAIISSGTGLHLVWVLDETLTDQREWQARALGLGAHLSALDLRIDRARIGDCSNGCRVPGTINGKHGDLVRLMRWGRGAIPRDVWDRLIPAYPPEPPPAQHPPLDDSAFTAAPIAERCAQIRAFRDGAALSEPIWKACIDVLAHCRDGDEIVHQWSAKDPRYRQEETQDKLTRAKEVRPALCKRFRIHNPDTCRECPEKINSPISLGRGKLEQPSLPEQPAPRKLPAGYFARDGLIWTTRKKQELEVCTELYVIAVTQADDGILKCKIEIVRHGKTTVMWFNRWESEIQRATVQLKHKIWYRSSSILDAYLTEATLLAEQQGKEMTKLYTMFGWDDDRHSFVPGSMVLGQNSTSQIDTANYPEIIRGCEPTGSYEKWKAYVARVCQSGMETSAFLVCLSAGAPIHYLLAPSEGGIMVLLRSHQSGLGKTTALAAALSIWGDWQQLRVATIDSDLARLRKFGFIRHLPIGWDEAITSDIEKFYAQIMEFSDGHPRGRLNRDGTSRPNELTWSTFLIGTTNMAIRLRLATTKNVTNGGLARILELDAKPGAKNDGGELRNAFDRHYGHAGRKIIAALLENPKTIETMQEQLQAATTARMQRLGWTTDYRLIARAVTCAEAGGELLNKIGLELDVATIIRAVEDEINTVSQDSKVVGDVVNQYLHANNAHLVVIGSSRPPPPLREIRARYDMKTRCLFLPFNEWKRWCAELNMKSEDLMKLVREQRHRVSTGCINLTEGTGLPSGKSDDCIVIKVATGKETKYGQDPDDAKVIELKNRIHPPDPPSEIEDTDEPDLDG